MESINVEIGKRVKLARKTIEVSQMALSKELGLSRSSVTNMEKGKQSMSAATIYRISNFLGVSVGSLFPEARCLISPADQSRLISAIRMIEKSSVICSGILNSDKVI